VGDKAGVKETWTSYGRDASRVDDEGMRCTLRDTALYAGGQLNSHNRGQLKKSHRHDLFERQRVTMGFGFQFMRVKVDGIIMLLRLKWLSFVSLL
jgi:hypothetical protein